jgi:hypothetical protein
MPCEERRSLPAHRAPPDRPHIAGAPPAERHGALQGGDEHVGAVRGLQGGELTRLATTSRTASQLRARAFRAGAGIKRDSARLIVLGSQPHIAAAPL